jgi:FSR family fosmidomycin resistance protein-like MFS transporter
MFLLPDILISRGYDSSISMGYGHLMYVLGSASMMIPAGYLADKFSSRSVIVTAMILSTISIYSLLLMPILSNVALLTILFVLGSTLGLVTPVAVALATRLAPNQKGLVTAFSLGLVLCVSEVIGHSGGGLVTTFFEDDAPAKALAVIGGFLFFGTAAASSLTQEEKMPATVETTE